MHADDSDMAFHCQDCGKRYPARARRDFENHCKTHTGVLLKSVLRIRIRRIQMFLGLLDPGPDPLVRGADRDPYIMKQKYQEKP